MDKVESAQKICEVLSQIELEDRFLIGYNITASLLRSPEFHEWYLKRKAEAENVR